MNDKNNKTPTVCSGNCKSADVKECLDVHIALKELEDAIRTDLDDTGHKDHSGTITHVVMNSVIEWFQGNVEKIKLVKSDGN